MAIRPFGPIQHATGLGFEHRTAKLMSKLGFADVHPTQASQDFGIDVIGKLNYGRSFGIQCKHTSSPRTHIGYSAVEQTVSGVRFYRLACGIVLTNASFTQQARQGARKNGVLLWDRGDLDLLERLARAHLTIYDLLDYEKTFIPFVKLLLPRKRPRS